MEWLSVDVNLKRIDANAKLYHNTNEGLLQCCAKIPLKLGI